MLVSCVFLALMPLSGSFEVAAIFFVIRSVLTTVSWPILQSYMMGIVLERERATVTGITYTAWALMSSAGTFLGGYLLGEGQLTLPFVFGVFGYVTSAVLLFLFFRKIKPPEELKVDLGFCGNQIRMTTTAFFKSGIGNILIIVDARCYFFPRKKCSQR